MSPNKDVKAFIIASPLKLKRSAGISSRPTDFLLFTNQMFDSTSINLCRSNYTWKWASFVDIRVVMVKRTPILGSLKYSTRRTKLYSLATIGSPFLLQPVWLLRSLVTEYPSGYVLHGRTSDDLASPARVSTRLLLHSHWTTSDVHIHPLHQWF